MAKRLKITYSRIGKPTFLSDELLQPKNPHKYNYKSKAVNIDDMHEYISKTLFNYEALIRELLSFLNIPYDWVKIEIKYKDYLYSNMIRRD
jgi:hypothetical protein